MGHFIQAPTLPLTKYQFRCLIFCLWFSVVERVWNHVRTFKTSSAKIRIIWLKLREFFMRLKGNFGWGYWKWRKLLRTHRGLLFTRNVFQTIFCWSVSFISSLFTLQSSDTIPDSEIKLFCKYSFPFLWTSICQCFHYLSCSGNFDVSISLLVTVSIQVDSVEV